MDLLALKFQMVFRIHLINFVSIKPIDLRHKYWSFFIKQSAVIAITP